MRIRWTLVLGMIAVIGTTAGCSQPSLNFFKPLGTNVTSVAVVSSNTVRKQSNAKAPAQPVAFGRGSFDPLHLIQVYDDDIYVTEQAGVIYVSWTSFDHGNTVYTSIYDHGHWSVTDQPVYYPPTGKSSVELQTFLSGNTVYVVNRMQDLVQAVYWDQSGKVVFKHSLYKGWFAGAFPIQSTTGLDFAVHVPYGAPPGGAHYYIYNMQNPNHPLSFTTPKSSFIGEFYALNAQLTTLYESRRSSSGGYVLDAYSVTTGQPLLRGGTPVAIHLPSRPLGLQVASDGTVRFFTVRRSGNNRFVTLMSADASLSHIVSRQEVKLPSPYAANEQLTVQSNQDNMFEAYNDQGDAMLSRETGIGTS